MWLKLGNVWVALLTFLLEAGKIVAAMQAIWLLTANFNCILIAGFIAIVGHGYSPFSNFRPCRSSTVYTGFCFAVNIWAGVWLLAIWVIAFAITRRQYLAILLQLFSLPLVLFVYKGSEASFVGVLLFAYGVWHHRRAFGDILQKREVAWPKHALIATLATLGKRWL